MGRRPGPGAGSGFPSGGRITAAPPNVPSGASGRGRRVTRRRAPAGERTTALSRSAPAAAACAGSTTTSTPRIAARRAASPGRRAACAETRTLVGSPGRFSRLTCCDSSVANPAVHSSASARVSSTATSRPAAGRESAVRPSRSSAASQAGRRSKSCCSVRRVVQRVEPLAADEDLGGPTHLGVVDLVEAPAVEPGDALAHQRGSLADLGHHRATQAEVHVDQPLAGEPGRGRGEGRVHEAADRHRERLRDAEQEPQLPLVVDAREREDDLGGSAFRRLPQALEMAVHEVGGREALREGRPERRRVEARPEVAGHEPRAEPAAAPRLLAEERPLALDERAAGARPQEEPALGQAEEAAVAQVQGERARQGSPGPQACRFASRCSST